MYILVIVTFGAAIIISLSDKVVWFVSGAFKCLAQTTHLTWEREKKEDIKRGNIKRVEENRRPGSDFADGKMVHLALGVALPRVV